MSAKPADYTADVATALNGLKPCEPRTFIAIAVGYDRSDVLVSIGVSSPEPRSVETERELMQEAAEQLAAAAETWGE